MKNFLMLASTMLLLQSCSWLDEPIIDLSDMDLYECSSLFDGVFSDHIEVDVNASIGDVVSTTLAPDCESILKYTGGNDYFEITEDGDLVVVADLTPLAGELTQLKITIHKTEAGDKEEMTILITEAKRGSVIIADSSKFMSTRRCYLVKDTISNWLVHSVFLSDSKMSFEEEITTNSRAMGLYLFSRLNQIHGYYQSRDSTIDNQYQIFVDSRAIVNDELSNLGLLELISVLDPKREEGEPIFPHAEISIDTANLEINIQGTMYNVDSIKVELDYSGPYIVAAPDGIFD